MLKKSERFIMLATDNKLKVEGVFPPASSPHPSFYEVDPASQTTDPQVPFQETDFGALRGSFISSTPFWGKRVAALFIGK